MSVGLQCNRGALQCKKAGVWKKVLLNMVFRQYLLIRITKSVKEAAQSDSVRMESDMLAVMINDVRLEYDVHALIKAFYPEEQVCVLTPETAQDKKSKLEDCVRAELTTSEKGAILTLDETRYEWAAEHGRVLSKKQYKDELKRFLYRTLNQHTGRLLPWGNLTGIRPTKIAMGMLEEGRSGQDILAFMEQEHYVSEKKAVLSLDIAKREKKLLADIHEKEGYSLYIGIPFCPTTCLYCSFTSYPICTYRDRVEAYLDCVIQEMKYVADIYRDKILDTVYIGGGTPTTLEAAQLERLIKSIQELFDLSALQEFTVEAGRADSITADKLQTLYQLGVTRISINPQTMKEETLRIIGRQHTVEQVKEAFRLARAIGFDNINMDIILGLPGETKADVVHTIEEIKRLKPDSLTVHSLAIKRASGLNRYILEHGMEALHNTDEMMNIAAEGAGALAMKPYYLYRQKNMSGNFENVGYAQDGKYGLYNILIMEEKQTIVALGAGSISKLVLPDGRIERADNVKDVVLYIDKIEEMIARKKHLLTEL